MDYENHITRMMFKAFLERHSALDQRSVAQAIGVAKSTLSGFKGGTGRLGKENLLNLVAYMKWIEVKELTHCITLLIYHKKCLRRKAINAKKVLKLGLSI